MAEGFLNKEDVRMRLDNTICFLKDMPVFIVFDQDLPLNTVYYTPLHAVNRHEPKKVEITKPEFSYRAATLGYIQIDGNAYYLTRIPERRQKAGTPLDCIKGVPNHIRQQWYLSENMRDCIKGTGYWTVEEALRIMDDVEIPGNSYRLHRHFAIQNIDGHCYGLMHRGKLVGSFDPDAARFRIFQNEKDASFLERVCSNAKLPV